MIIYCIKDNMRIIEKQNMKRRFSQLSHIRQYVNVHFYPVIRVDELDENLLQNKRNK